MNLLTRCLDQQGDIVAACRGEAFRAVTMAITLQSSVEEFSDEFMRRLPQLEQAMVTHGLEPSEFVIAKDRAPGARWIVPFFNSYTVFFGEDNFTVVEPDDLKFYDYFYQRCTTEDEADRDQPPQNNGLIHRLFRWMERPV